MVVRINNLTESLERLSESNMPLTERFDDSFPKWLKDRLTLMGNLYSGKKDWNWIRNNIPYEERPSYSNARDERYTIDSDRSLFNKALNAGIDFTNTRVIEGPIPEKRTDERLKEPNIPIWYFDDGGTGQVYIEGVNDTEIYRPTGKPFKYMPMKDKLANAAGFAYIDGSKINAGAVTDKRADRSAIQKELRELPNYTRKGTKEDELFGRHSYSASTDKSGYSIENPLRYRKELERIQGRKVYDYLQQMHDDIQDAKINVMDAYAIMDPDDDNVDKLRDIMSYIKRAQWDYNNYMSTVENILNASYLDENDKLNRCSNVIQSMKSDSNMHYIRELGGDIFLKDIDWD